MESLIFKSLDYDFIYLFYFYGIRLINQSIYMYSQGIVDELALFHAQSA